MTDTTPAPIRGILKAFHRGTTITKRLAKDVQNASSAQSLDVLEVAQQLERSLRESQHRIQDAYIQKTRVFGHRFGRAIIDDSGVTNRLQALTINLVEQILSLDDCADDSDTFDLGSFPYVQREAERTCEQTLHTLELLATALKLDGASSGSPEVRDDRAQLSSQRMQNGSLQSEAPLPKDNLHMANGRSPGCVATDSTSAIPPPVNEIPSNQRRSRAISIPKTPLEAQPPSPLSYGTPEHHMFPAAGPPEPPRSAWDLPKTAILQRLDNSGEHVSDTGKNAQTSLDTPLLNETIEPFGNSAGGSAGQASSHTRSPNSESATAVMIERDEVERQMRLNEELLERRRLSRLAYRQSQYLSTARTPTSGAEPENGSVSPILLSTGSFVSSPTCISRPNSDQLMTRYQMRDSRDSLAPHGPRLRDSAATTATSDGRSSLHDNVPGAEKIVLERRESEPMMFGPMEGSSETTTSNGKITDGPNGNNVSTPPRVPTLVYVDEKQVVGQDLVSDPGPIPVEPEASPGPAVQPRPVDLTIGHDASFFKYGGFCDGAKMVQTGVGDALKVIKRPGTMGSSASLVSVRCCKCTYEIKWEDYENDKALDRAGIFNIIEAPGIRFRQRFLAKSHLPAKHIHEPVFACIFCIEEGRTVDDHDATVFFTVTQLIQHLQKHARPLRTVEGIVIMYGDQPQAVDFDLCFRDMESKPNPFAERRPDFRDRPTAFAMTNNRENVKGFKESDPEHNRTLRFALGARIVGITYPPKYNGEWCRGYHDGKRAMFPAGTIQLNAPPKDLVPPNQKSTLVAVVKWEHRPPKESNTPWLRLKPKEKITNIAFPYQDFWCWSGMNHKGIYGLFPSSFVEGLKDTATDKPGLTSRAVQVISAGTEERWSGGGASGIFAGVASSPTVHPANAPRPVRRHRTGSGRSGESGTSAPEVVPESSSAGTTRWGLGRVTSKMGGRRATSGSLESVNGLTRATP